MAGRIVSAKIYNQRRVLQRLLARAEEPPEVTQTAAVHQIENQKSQIENSADVETLAKTVDGRLSAKTFRPNPLLYFFRIGL